MLFIIDGPGGFRPLALPIYRDIGDRLGDANALTSLGDVARMQGRYPDAAALYDQALPIYRQIAARAGEANALLGLGRTLAGQGSPAAATALREAARVYDLLGRSDLAKVATREADAASPGEAGPQTG